MRILAILTALALGGMSHTAEAASDIRLNEADAAAFSTIEGVDEALASRIVGLRHERGTIGSIEALRVLDIEPGTLDNLRREVIIDMPLNAVKKGGKRYANVQEVLGEFVDEPDIRAVQAMAMAYTKTNPELVDGWLQASRKAYLLPKMNLQYEKELDMKENYEYEATEEDAEAQLDQADYENDDKYVVKLEWRLDKLVMSSERIRVISEAQDVVKLRDKVLDEVTRVYFDRRRLQVDMLLKPSADLKTQLENELRLQELSANLDAYTGGAFSAALRH